MYYWGICAIANEAAMYYMFNNKIFCNWKLEKTSRYEITGGSAHRRRRTANLKEISYEFDDCHLSRYLFRSDYVCGGCTNEYLGWWCLESWLHGYRGFWLITTTNYSRVNAINYFDQIYQPNIHLWSSPIPLLVRWLNHYMSPY